MIDRAEFKMLRAKLKEPAHEAKFEWIEVGTTSILISDLKRAIIESYKDHHDIIWLSSIDGKCAHRVTVKEDPMKFIEAEEKAGEAKHGD